MSQTLLTIVAQESQTDFVVYHWIADSSKLTCEMTDWLAEACTTNYDCLDPVVRGFVAGGFWDENEDEEDEDYHRGRKLAEGVWKHKFTEYVTYGEFDAVFTALFCFF
jgi:hypothetical protein